MPETVVNDADARAALGGGGTGRHIVFCVLIREKNFKNNPDYNQLSIGVSTHYQVQVITIGQLK